MTMDIVERLRDGICTYASALYGSGNVDLIKTNNMLKEAADEIECLHRDLDIERQTNAVLVAEVNKLRTLTTWHRIDDPDNPPPKTDESEMLTKPFLAICPDKDAPDGYDINICWWEPRMNSRGGCWWGDGDFRLYPTHWIPLPTPPEDRT